MPVISPPQGTGSVTTTAILDGTVATADIADDAVTAAELRDDASTDANRAVTTDHIRDLAVTNAKLAGSIDNAKLATNPLARANHTGTQTLASISDAGTIASQSAAAVAITGGSVTGITDLAVADGGTGASTAAAARTNLGSTTVGDAVFVAATAAAARTAIGTVIGTDVQAYDAELAALAGLTSAADKGVQFTGAGTAGTFDLTAAGRALIDDADASAQRTTLGLGSIATQAASSVSITGGSVTGITDLAVADGGTGASDAATARTNLGAMAAPGSYAQRATPAFNTGYRPSTTRPTFVLASFYIDSVTSTDDGQIDLLIDSAATPTTKVATLMRVQNADAVNNMLSGQCVGFIVPANQYYLLDDVTTTGTVTFNFTLLYELTL